MNHEQAIRNLVAAYSHAVMRCDAKLAAAVYVDDGELIAFGASPIQGRAAIAEGLGRALSPLAFFVHNATNGIVSVDGDSARASWSVTEWYALKKKEGLFVCMGIYEDVLTNTPAGWRFARRTFQPFYQGSLPEQGKRFPEAVFTHDYAPWPFISTQN